MKAVEGQNPYAMSTFVFVLLWKAALFAFIHLDALLDMTGAVPDSGQGI